MEHTFGVPFDNCPDECGYLREVTNELECITLQLIRVRSENLYLQRKLEKVRHERHVYKVEMNRCRRKLEAVYKYCDSMMHRNWKDDFSMCRKMGWL